MSDCFYSKAGNLHLFRTKSVSHCLSPRLRHRELQGPLRRPCVCVPGFVASKSCLHPWVCLFLFGHRSGASDLLSPVIESVFSLAGRGFSSDRDVSPSLGFSPGGFCICVLDFLALPNLHSLSYHSPWNGCVSLPVLLFLGPHLIAGLMPSAWSTSPRPKILSAA